MHYISLFTNTVNGIAWAGISVSTFVFNVCKLWTQTWPAAFLSQSSTLWPLAKHSIPSGDKRTSTIFITSPWPNSGLLAGEGRVWRVGLLGFLSLKLLVWRPVETLEWSPRNDELSCYKAGPVPCAITLRRGHVYRSARHSPHLHEPQSENATLMSSW